jgi:hypothetical protein
MIFATENSSSRWESAVDGDANLAHVRRPHARAVAQLHLLEEERHDEAEDRDRNRPQEHRVNGVGVRVDDGCGRLGRQPVEPFRTLRGLGR